MSRTRKRTVAIAGIAALAMMLAVPTVSAASALTKKTVRAILDNPVRDEIVTVEGNLAQHLGGNDYVLEDGTGRIVVDGGLPWHRELALPVGKRVTVTGEVGMGPPHAKTARAPEIDIVSVVLPNGTTLKVREAQGPPLWAGSPPWARGGNAKRPGPPGGSSSPLGASARNPPPFTACRRSRPR